MNTLLELAGAVCLVAFLFIVWPPLVLAGVGVLLIAAANRPPTHSTVGDH